MSSYCTHYRHPPNHRGSHDARALPTCIPLLWPQPKDISQSLGLQAPRDACKSSVRAFHCPFKCHLTRAQREREQVVSVPWCSSNTFVSFYDRAHLHYFLIMRRQTFLSPSINRYSLRKHTISHSMQLRPGYYSWQE